MDFRLAHVINRKGWLICTTGNQDKSEHQAGIHEQAHQGKDQQGDRPVIEQLRPSGDVFFKSRHTLKNRIIWV